MTWHIVGVDLSLTGTGIATIRPEAPVDERIRTTVIGSSSIPNGAADKYPLTLTRLRNLAGKIVRAVKDGTEEGDVIVVVIEGPALGAMQGQVHIRAGLWWLVYHLLEKIALVVIIEPSKLKRYVTRKGNAPKDVVFSTIVRNFPQVDVVDNNEADALGLASMAARELGFPQEPSVQRCDPSALEGVNWPQPIIERRRAL